jgi:hypothetical protein
MKLFAPICGLTLCLLYSSAAAADCMIYDGGLQSVTGRIAIVRTKDAADRPETAIILTPSSATCLDAKDPDDRVNEATQVHVFSSDDKLHAQIVNNSGKVLTVWGEPFPAHTAHHHAPIVMDVTKLSVN